MPYIGNIPAESYSQVSYQDLTGGSGTSFTLDYPVGSAGEIEVFVNNVRQEPTVAYTVSGTSLTMTGSIAATDDFYVVFQGKAQQSIGIPEKQTDGTYLFGDSVTIDADGSTVLTVDRATSDGTIIDVQKSGTSVGSIGTNSSRTYIGSGSGQSGLKFNTGAIVPVSGADGVNNDAAYNLGVSTARFTNLYLSGGVYLGGTGSANLLDDYEEGTWTPTANAGITGFSIQSATYTKVGRMVTLMFYVTSPTGNSGSNLQIGGLPFTPASNNYSTGWMECNTVGHMGMVRTNSTNTYLSFFYPNASTSERVPLTGNDVGSSHIICSITYQTS